jgi:hypothetical protein
MSRCQTLEALLTPQIRSVFIPPSATDVTRRLNYSSATIESGVTSNNPLKRTERLQRTPALPVLPLESAQKGHAGGPTEKQQLQPTTCHVTTARPNISAIYFEPHREVA